MPAATFKYAALVRRSAFALMLAVKRLGGALWRDREGLAWTDPFRVAAEAAPYGFDEIQFDYVRFPDAHGLVFSAANNEENGGKTIAEFLQAARKRLLPYNVFLSADLFGYVCWNLVSWPRNSLNKISPTLFCKERV